MILKYRDNKIGGWTYVSGEKIKTVYFDAKETLEKAKSKPMTSDEAENFDYLDVLFEECMMRGYGYASKEARRIGKLDRIRTEYHVGNDFPNNITFVCAVMILNDGEDDQTIVFKTEGHTAYLLNDKGSTVERLF